MFRLYVVALLFLASSFLPRATAREWGDTTGAFKTEAEFIAFKNGKVYLEREGEQVIIVRLETLSIADRKYLAEQEEEVQAYLKSHPQLLPPRPKPKAKTNLVEITVPKGHQGDEVRRFPEMGWGLKSLAFSQTGGMLAAGKTDDCLLLFGLEDSVTLAKVDGLKELDQLTCCVFSPDNSKLIVGGSTGRIVVWNVDRFGRLKPYSEFYGHIGKVLCLSVSNDGKRVLSGDSEETLMYWDMKTGEQLHSFTNFERDVKACFITPSGKQGMGSDGESLILFDLEKGEAIQNMELLSGSPHGVAISPDGRQVAASKSYEIHVWSIQSGEGFVLKDREIQWTLQFSPDGEKIFAGGAAKVNVWDLNKKIRMKVFDTGSHAYVQTLAVSPDNQHVAAIGSSAGQDLQVFRLPTR